MTEEVAWAGPDFVCLGCGHEYNDDRGEAGCPECGTVATESQVRAYEATLASEEGRP